MCDDHVLIAEMHGFDSDEERLEYLSSLMDSADTTQQQPQNSGEGGTYVRTYVYDNMWQTHSSSEILSVRTSVLDLPCWSLE